MHGIHNVKLLHVISEKLNPYDKINERNSEWIYLDSYSWTKKAVFLGLFVDCWTLMMKGLRSFELSGNTRPATQNHFPVAFDLSNIAMTNIYINFQEYCTR